MSSETIGVVEQANVSYSPAGSPRKWVKRSLKVNGAWYSTFVNDKNKAMIESVNEGDSVRISYEQKGDFKNINTVAVVEAAKHDAPAGATAARPAYNPDTKDFRITFLASRKDSMEFVKMLIAADAVSLGTKKSDKADILYGLINKYAAKMTADAWHPEVVKDETIDNDVEEAKQYAVE